MCLKSDPEATQVEGLNNTTSERPSFKGTSSPQTSTDTTGNSSPPQAVVPSFTNKLETYRRKRTPLVVIRPIRWQDKSANLLFRKAAAVYHSLSCMFNSNEKYGRGLKSCKLALKCLEACRCNEDDSDCKEYRELLISVLYVCGDAYLMLAKCQDNLEVHREDFRFMSEEDKFIAHIAEEYFVDQSTYLSELELTFLSEAEKNLLKR